MSQKIKDGDIVKCVKNVGSKENDFLVGKLLSIMYAGFAGVVGIFKGKPYTLKGEEIKFVRHKYRPRNSRVRATKRERTKTMRVLKDE